MVSLLLNVLLLPAAGFALFRLWRATRSEQRLVNAVIAAGFVGRSLAGQVLFWISYLRIPFARHLQIGDGLWFFALDAVNYVPASRALAHDGVGAIVAYTADHASVAFVKTLSVFTLLFGDAAAVAVLLNLFCYLGTMAVIVDWSRKEPRGRFAAAVAVCAISLSPAVFLWSLQPLKEAFFQFIVIVFIGACAAWQRLWAAGPIRPRSIVLPAAAMLVTLLAIAGVRWYFAFGLFLAAAIFLLLVAATSAARKSVAFASAVVLLALLAQAFLFGAGPYVPPLVQKTLAPWAAAQRHGMPLSLVAHINLTRDGFERAAGNTAIRLGGTSAEVDRKMESVPKVIEAVAAPAEMPKSVAGRLLTGGASLIVPRSVGERLGLFRIGGGQGMFWFTELDTLVFDAILLWVVIVLAMRISTSWRNPMVVFLALLTLSVMVPLAYTIANYGTLFRLRAMIYSALVSIPIAVAIAPRREVRLEAS